MTISLLRPYSTFATGAVVTLPDNTEAALIAQGFATASLTTSVPSLVGGPDTYLTQYGNVALANQAGQSTPTYMQGKSIVTNMQLGTAALTAAGGSSVHVAGTMNISEIYVPHWNTWKGIAMLNGTTATTDNFLVALYGASGALIANSAVAGTVASGASTFQKRDFTSPVTLPPGLYFCGVQCNGTTAHSMKFLSANQNDVLTAAVAGTFGTVPSSITVPTTFTTAQGVVCQLYTV